MTNLCVVYIRDLIGFGMTVVILLTSLAFDWRRLDKSKAMKQSWIWDVTNRGARGLGFISVLDLL